jgi:anti-anti-sigma factor
VIVVHFAGHGVCLDGLAIQDIRDQLFALAEEPCRSPLLLDLGNVNFVGGMALGTLLILDRKVRAAGRRLILCKLNPQVLEVFVVARLNTVLDLRGAEPWDELAPPGGPAGPPTGVLVVDDDTAALCVLAARLRRAGFRVWLAGHDRQAMEMYQRHQEEIAVVLLGVLVPGIDGRHTLTALRAVHPAIRCCFLTEDPEAGADGGLRQMGAVRVFQKPLAFAEVRDTLGQLAHRRPGGRLDRWITLPR